MPAFGITTFPTDYAISPIELAEAVEERRFDSLFFNEHTHIPVSRRSPFPGGGELPGSIAAPMTRSSRCPWRRR
jgi:alkanesulfonate monooxygenase SsuD/methylene tetrahydromethanopterin reductase-like flavin-dependent oxidoreductase (luciferase family)